ncbi:ribosomal protein S18-alanine N-acetyltransferase [Psychromicrobium xiongbiense]|uniref:ribosomal protein S18-alanine N-acetyltransferase n=1 Tax=Psychromicrobium xiongbiense TaxID=3051184 RepID=UPI002556CFBF|nr:ribosomal protein S18-alanine N-acetyltransferase [Psychromicrobium sp. YIM S02556]
MSQKPENQHLPEGVTLRPMVPDDLTVVVALEQRLFPLDAWPARMFGDELAQPSRSYLILEHDHHGIIGYSGLMCLPPVADVQTIAVIPEWEGHGLGTALMRALLEEAHQRGATEVLLEVREDNPRAQQLYLRFGFVHIHTRPRYYRDGTGAWVMRLELDAVTTQDKKQEIS